jgi:hypothetical protein
VEAIGVSQRVCVVTNDAERADQYQGVVESAESRHITRWCPDRIDDIDVVLFDPETVDRETIVASRLMNDRRYWIVAMTADPRTTIERVERAVAGRQFEIAIDARFDRIALIRERPKTPLVTVPDSLDTTTIRELYAGL